MKLPSREKCFQLMDKYGMYENIKKHSRAVEAVAVFLARELKKKDIFVDEDLVSRASLLHDIGKTEEIKNGGHHSEIGERILTKEGHDELGKFCAKHYCGREKDLKTLEEKIINYADKRVLHDKIVDMPKRYEYLKKRYPRSFEREGVDEDIKIAYNIEKEIFSNLDIKPNDINNLVINN